MMKILCLLPEIRSEEYMPFTISDIHDTSNSNRACIEEHKYYNEKGLESYFSFRVEYFDEFVDKNSVEILHDFPNENEKYIILWNLLDIVSFNQEILQYWDEWYNKKDKVFLRMIDDLRNNRCSIIFHSLHDSECDNMDSESQRLRESIINWFETKDIPLNRISYVGNGASRKKEWWKDITSFRVHYPPLNMHRIVKGLTPDYYLGGFVNSLYHLRQKHFLTFNSAPKAGIRSKLVKFLGDNDYVKKGYVSYKPYHSHSTSLGLKKRYLDSSDETHGDPRGDITRHDNTFIQNCTKELISKYNNRSLYALTLSSHSGWRSNSPLHFNSYFNIVSTSGANTGLEESYSGVDLDEKIWKPIIHFQPFIIVGNSGILKRVRKYGFKTFEPFIDESYDEKGPDDMDLVLKEIDKLCRMNRVEIDKWYWEMNDILLYNFNHFFKFCNDQMKLVMDEVERHWSLT